MPKNPKPSSLPISSASHQADIPLGEILTVLDGVYQFHPMHDVTEGEPYKVLVGTLLSLRTNDDVTIPACARLFAVADTPEKMLQLDSETIQKIIYPVGFYRNKADTILQVTRDLMERFGGKVPDTIEELLTLNGVGRKTANLVVGLGHRLPAVCVDTHVHRICNRLGYLETKTPEETEMVIREKLEQQYWHIINRVLVLHGREICKPIGARCDVCPVASQCGKINVKPRKPPGATAAKTKTPKQ